jgi:LPS export ABC transporter protein LptC
MKRLLLAMLVLAGLGAAALWLSGTQDARNGKAGTASEAAMAAYDFEATDVVLRQTDATGRLQYEIEADRIIQLPDNGTIEASGLTLHHDPAGTEPGSPNRWTLTANAAELPTGATAVVLNGAVRAEGRLLGSNLKLQVATEQLRYDMDLLEFTSEQPVDLVWGAGNRFRVEKNMRVNIKTSDMELESVRGTLVP